MVKKIKAQTATEFLVIFMIFIAVLTIASFYSLQRVHSVVIYRTEFEATKVLNDVSNKIDIAFLEGDGFMINASLPESILGHDYEITITENVITLTTDNVTYSRILLTQNITGSIVKGQNLIYNNNGLIVI